MLKQPGQRSKPKRNPAGKVRREEGWTWISLHGWRRTAPGHQRRRPKLREAPGSERARSISVPCRTSTRRVRAATSTGFREERVSRSAIRSGRAAAGMFMADEQAAAESARAHQTQILPAYRSVSHLREARAIQARCPEPMHSVDESIIFGNSLQSERFKSDRRRPGHPEAAVHARRSKAFAPGCNLGRLRLQDNNVVAGLLLLRSPPDLDSR
jgi:hypothetical protein